MFLCQLDDDAGKTEQCDQDPGGDRPLPADLFHKQRDAVGGDGRAHIGAGIHTAGNGGDVAVFAEALRHVRDQHQIDTVRAGGQKHQKYDG